MSSNVPKAIPKVLFVYFRFQKVYSAAVASLSAYIKARGFSNVKVVCFDDSETSDEIRERFGRIATEYAPELVCFSCMTAHWNAVRLLAKLSKQVTSAVTLVGGYHPSLFPESVLDEPAVDAICVGEGEGALAEVLSRMPAGSLTGIQNIWTRSGDGTVLKTSVRPIISDLDELPFPDREVFRENGINELGQTVLEDLLGNKTVANLSTGRGCPFKCTFCSNDAFRNLYEKESRDNFCRRFSIDRIVKEAAALNEQYDPDFFEFLDEVFPSRTDWLAAFKEKFTREVGKPFSTCIRIGMNKFEGYRLLREAGCFMVFLGLECGNEAYRAQMLGKPISNEKIVSETRILKDLGILVGTFNIVFLPFETEENIRETIELNRRIQTDIPLFFSYQPLPGTPLFDICNTADLIPVLENDARMDYYSRQSRLHTTISEAQSVELWQAITDLQRDRIGQIHLASPKQGRT